MPNLARNQCVLIFSHLPQSSEGESFDAFNLGTIESPGTPELQECDTFTSSALSTDTYKSKMQSLRNPSAIWHFSLLPKSYSNAAQATIAFSTPYPHE